MKVLISIDSFKGSLSSIEAGEAIKRGILRAKSDTEVVVLPLGDGGEGTTDALRLAYKAKRRTITTLNPIGRKIRASYYIVGNRAIMEMSASAGLCLIKESQRDPMHTTTYGVGLMIRDAIENGATEFLIGVGGSATNDGGIGMLQALGFSFLDCNGNEVGYGAYGAGSVCKVFRGRAMTALKDCTFKILCDVQNPLLGPNGASYVYSYQKGARGEVINLLEGCLKSFAKATRVSLPKADPYAPGAGAAGGLGFAFLSYLGAELLSGAHEVLRATRFEEHLEGANIVITGEGRIDSQSVNGKAPIIVAEVAKRHSKRVIGLCGITGDGYEACYEAGIDEIHAIADPSKTTEENMKKEIAIANLENKAYEIFSKI